MCVLYFFSPKFCKYVTRKSASPMYLGLAALGTFMYLGLAALGTF